MASKLIFLDFKNLNASLDFLHLGLCNNLNLFIINYSLKKLLKTGLIRHLILRQYYLFRVQFSHL